MDTTKSPKAKKATLTNEELILSYKGDGKEIQADPRWDAMRPLLGTDLATALALQGADKAEAEAAKEARKNAKEAFDKAVAKALGMKPDGTFEEGSPIGDLYSALGRFNAAMGLTDAKRMNTIGLKTFKVEGKGTIIATQVFRGGDKPTEENA